MLALGSEFDKNFSFLFGKCHNIFLHIQSSHVDYEGNIPHYLRHYKIDETLAAVSIFGEHWSTFEVRTLSDLHAKCICIDNQIIFTGSVNWYRYSLEESIEIVLRGHLDTISGLNIELEGLWKKGEVLKIDKNPINKTIQNISGITHEVIDPTAAKVLKENPKAFRLGSKNRP